MNDAAPHTSEPEFSSDEEDVIHSDEEGSDEIIPGSDDDQIETSQSHPSKNTHQTKLDAIESTCVYLHKTHTLTVKLFLERYLTSKKMSIASRRKQWISKWGWPSTLRILDSIRNLAYQTVNGRTYWETYILNEAKHIVNSESPPVRSTGSFDVPWIDPSAMVHADIDRDASLKRDQLIKQRMPFISELIWSKLVHAHRKKLPLDLQATLPPIDEAESIVVPASFKPSTVDPVTEDDDELSDDLSGPEVNQSVGKKKFIPESRAIRYWRSRKKEENLHTRLQTIQSTLVSMLAFACNRRCNGLQLENALTFLACGVTERINSYMSYIGLSSSRKSAMRGLRHLGKVAAENTRVLMRKSGTVSSMVVDNIDIQEHLHHTRLDSRTKMYHGSWGYIHSFSPHVMENWNPQDFSLNNLKSSILEASKKAVNATDLFPDHAEHARWILTLKAQIANVLKQYTLDPSKISKSTFLNLPPVDQIKCDVPETYMLKMMDSTDNGSEGVGQLYQELIGQTGVDPKKFAQSIRIIEGDLGTCLNFNGLIQQRDPTHVPQESMDNILLIPGAGHTLWNIAHALLLHHWGDPSDVTDLGAWQTVVALGGKKDIPTSKKDFTSMIQLMERIHTVTITFALLQILGLKETSLEQKINLSLVTFEDAVNKTYQSYFSGAAILQAKKDNDQKKLQLLQRIHDFATVVEASRSMSAGDIGCLMYMWQRWSVMIQGLKGLTHYSNYLPRLVFLLTKTLPHSISHAILHSMLIAPSGRANHFVAKDVFLEIQNFWIKFFYNHSGTGSEIARLRDAFSINIPFLRSLLQRLKARSGLNDVIQSSKNILTLRTVSNFVSSAKDWGLGSTCPDSHLPTGPVSDLFQLGTRKLREDGLHNRLARFHWPIHGFHGYSDSANELQTEEMINEEPFEINEQLLDLVEG